MLISSLGGVELVLTALGKHSSHVGVQKSGLGALQNLALNGSLCGMGVNHTVWMTVV